MTLTEPEARQHYLDYDACHDLDPQDPAVDDLALRLVEATRRRYGSGDMPGKVAGSDVPGLAQGAVNAASPAWGRLDALVRQHLTP